MSSLNSTFFEIEVDGGVAHLAMNRPEKANGMSPDFWEDLPRLTKELEQDMTIRAMVISGKGKHFTGGMDLSAFGSIMDLLKSEPGRSSYEMRKLVLKLQNSFNALEEARFPVIAAIHGACIGGGIDMISACDIRLASNDATFSIEEINIGMTADVGTLQRLPKLMAPGIVKELAYTGRRFSAIEAKDWGFINTICDSPQDVLVKAIDLARQIATKSPLAISGIKKSIDYARDHNVADGLNQIATWNGGMLRPEDLMGAIKAKMEKKQAVFADLLQSK
ncbi:MAG: crotonase/enoyl-CoA hydratase family protein [Hyphomicrobiales bacterium]|nr:crotonase/enoyl-CoA hydratase family protein [Hyphomicrobiales bacterium]